MLTNSFDTANAEEVNQMDLQGSDKNQTKWM